MVKKKIVKKTERASKPVKKTSKPLPPSKPLKPSVHKPSQPAAPKARYVRAAAPDEETLSRLVRKGQQRGFITENEILFTFSNVEDYVDAFREFLDRIDRLGVHFIEMKEGILGREKEHGDVYTKIRTTHTAKKHNEVPELSQDSIQMYLREIG